MSEFTWLIQMWPDLESGNHYYFVTKFHTKDAEVMGDKIEPLQVLKDVKGTATQTIVAHVFDEKDQALLNEVESAIGSEKLNELLNTCVTDAIRVSGPKVSEIVQKLKQK